MGYKIGVPSIKLNNSGKKSKHCGSFGGVAYEGLEERKGLDKDINPELSCNNIYTGYRTAAELMEYSAEHVAQLRDAAGRKLRKDAVVMCATIFKPPAVYMNSLPVEAQQRLLGDCLEFFESVVGKGNIKSTAQHYDELGGHLHVFWEPMTADGRLCAKEVHSLKFYAHINQYLPAYLRDRGWEIDDADCYDVNARKLEDEKGKEEAYQKRKQNGRSSAAYKLEAERQKNALNRENQELRIGNSKLLGQKGKLEYECDQLRDDNAALVAQQGELQASIQQSQQSKADLEQERQQLMQTNAELERQRQQAYSETALARSRTQAEKERCERLQRLNESNLEVIGRNEAIIQEQEHTLGLIDDYEEYCAVADMTEADLDLGERMVRKLPPPKGIFRPSEEKEWLRDIKALLQKLLFSIGESLRRLRIFESRYEVPERRSEAVQEREMSLEDKMANAFARAGIGSSAGLMSYQKDEQTK